MLSATPGTIRLVAACASLFVLVGCHKAAPSARPPLSVDVAPALVQAVPVYGNWVATLDGMVNAQIQPQVGGYVIRQDYKEGTEVRKGQVLFEIDPRPWQATQDQANGSLSQAKAQYKLATINVNRDTPLVQAQAYAQSSLDTELGTQEADKASVESAEATLESAKLNVGFTKVRSLVTVSPVKLQSRSAISSRRARNWLKFRRSIRSRSTSLSASRSTCRCPLPLDQRAKRTC